MELKRGRRAMTQRRFVAGTLASLAEFVEHTQKLAQVLKAELSPGDWVLVKTCNSVYSIRKLDGERYLVSGGWFDRYGFTPVITAVAGCTWSGSMIKTDVVAACGLCLEFKNRIITSPIRTIAFLPHCCGN
jgi:hypothetical protein